MIVKTQIRLSSLAHRFKLFYLVIAAFSASTLGASDIHQQAAIEVNQSLTFTAILKHAMEHAPNAISRDARLQQAKSYESLGNSWISGHPNLRLNYIDDSSFDDFGETEMEAGLELPLWSWGAKRDSQKLGQSYTHETSAWENYFQWQIAGQLWTVLADIQQAEVVLNQAQRSRQAAQQLVEVAEKMFQAGDTSQDSVLQAESLLFDQEKNLLQAGAGLVDAERMYTTLTGLNQRPPQIPVERATGIDEIPLDHPLLQYLQASVEVKKALVNQARQEAKGNPSLSLGMRRQRGDGLEDYRDSLVAGISIPFGGGAYVSAQSSDVNRTKVDAEVDYHIAYRQLQQQLHEFKHELAITVKSIILSQKQVTLSKRRSQMARKAFDVGETSMTQLVQALQQYHTVAAEHQLLQLKQQRLISKLNQIVGKLP